VREAVCVAGAALAGIVRLVSRMICKRLKKLLHGSARNKGVRRILVLLG
jgi:hypothetical protein